ncbi:hypothetical protein CYLTODRAFT_417014 [Cylindrobasidium torrendii FP15055 ss-10]|uniref:Uncharacterized protein n=1 Tax=Cylindrobasidium torrendii FP15055 ss-10 TaxID=1314674 RepID=A0A0D7BSF0_9AGAR|nr:hypothetical protein CYLTODRAFT_417014 [Cylindrobasidium torrendii FP15055 ss-10]
MSSLHSNPEANETGGPPALVMFRKDESASAAQVLAQLKYFERGCDFFGKFVVSEVQWWKVQAAPYHEFLVVQVDAVADDPTGVLRGWENHTLAVLIDRNVDLDTSARAARRNSRLSSGSSASSRSEPSTASAPDLTSNSALNSANDDREGFRLPAISQASLRASSNGWNYLFGHAAFDRFWTYPGKSMSHITARKKADFVGRIKFDSTMRPFLFEELAMMAKVTSTAGPVYQANTTMCYWYVASIWGMISMLYPDVMAERNKIAGSFKKVKPKQLFGVNPPHEVDKLFKMFKPEWAEYEAEMKGLQQNAQEREQAKIREIELKAELKFKEDAERQAEAQRQAEQRAEAAEADRQKAEADRQKAEAKYKEDAERQAEAQRQVEQRAEAAERELEILKRQLGLSGSAKTS